MKNIRYYLFLSTGLILFTMPSITPMSQEANVEKRTAETAEEAKDQTPQPAVSPEKTVGTSDDKPTQCNHCCPFCNCEFKDYDGEDYFDYPFFVTMQNALEQSAKRLAQLRQLFQTESDSLTKGMPDKALGSIQIFTPTEPNKYGIKIMLPGYDQKDLSVTVKTTQREFSAPRNTVHITAKKATQTDETKSEDKEKPMVNRYMSSISYINDNRQETTYENGELTIDFDLPADVNVDPNNYSMTFENETLTLIFQTLPKEATLQFNEKKQEEEKKDK